VKKPELFIFAMFVAGTVSLWSGCNAPRSPKCVGQECLEADADAKGFCVINEDCATGETCKGGNCQPQNGGICAVNNDCSLGMFCNIIRGKCVECLDHDHCDLPLVCRADGTCGADSPCSSDGQCGVEVCDETLGFCVECVINDDCPDDNVCRERRCRVPDNQPGCLSDTECQPYGQICDPTTSNCVQPECTTAAACATPLGCVNNRCKPCQSAGQCRNGEVCNTATGTCVQPSTGCTSDASCPGQHCRQSTGTCVDCLEDGHCDLNETCNPDVGVCLPTNSGCTGNGDCPGEYCLIATGDCVACLTAAHCEEEVETCSQAYTCIPVGSGDVGTPCDSADNCNDGLVCLGDQCSRPCIGSGKGGEEDCPLGSACYDFKSGTLDGLRMCVGSTLLNASTPGQPFDMAPGDDCTLRNGCQTGNCFADTNCARSCGANRDCSVGDVCYAAMDSSGVHTAEHLCFDSDLANYAAVGEYCNNSVECDSGLCVGTCGILGIRDCNSSKDCSLLSLCHGTCANHCRSNADCPTGEACNPWATTASYFEGVVTVCTTKFFNGTATYGASCTSSSQCASDWCVGGICTTPCGTSADCTGALSQRKCTPLTFMDNGEPLYSLTFCQ